MESKYFHHRSLWTLYKTDYYLTYPHIVHVIDILWIQDTYTHLWGTENREIGHMISDRKAANKLWTRSVKLWHMCDTAWLEHNNISEVSMLSRSILTKKILNSLYIVFDSFISIMLIVGVNFYLYVLLLVRNIKLWKMWSCLSRVMLDKCPSSDNPRTYAVMCPFVSIVCFSTLYMSITHLLCHVCSSLLNINIKNTVL